MNAEKNQKIILIKCFEVLLRILLEEFTYVLFENTQKNISKDILDKISFKGTMNGFFFSKKLLEKFLTKCFEKFTNKHPEEFPN